MLIGQAHPSVSMDDILSRYDETQILAFYLNVRILPCCICSPLRTDRNPSFGLYVSGSGRVRWIDYATNESGGLMDLLCSLWHCSFTSAVVRLYSDLFLLREDGVSVLPMKKSRVFTKQEHSSLSKIEVKVRPWQDYDFEYWSSYGVESCWLRWAEVWPVLHKVVTKTDGLTGKVSRSVFKADKYAYVFVERKDRRLQLKIYQPFNNKGFKWCSKMDGSVISLWTKIPAEGDKVVICSSLKDALCLMSQLRIPCLALQGEGYGMSRTAVSELKKRFDKVFIAFDTDAPGIADSHRLAAATGFTPVFPDLGEQKDFSDFFKSLKNKEDFKRLHSLFK